MILNLIGFIHDELLFFPPFSWKLLSSQYDSVLLPIISPFSGLPKDTHLEHTMVTLFERILMYQKIRYSFMLIPKKFLKNNAGYYALTIKLELLQWKRKCRGYLLYSAYIQFHKAVSPLSLITKEWWEFRHCIIEISNRVLSASPWNYNPQDLGWMDEGELNIMVKSIVEMCPYQQTSVGK